jgi:uncharacterized membrane protein YvbJ
MSDSTIAKRYCPECRKSISRYADKCPYCTADISSTSANKTIIAGTIGAIVLWKEILIVIIVAIITYFIATSFTKRYAIDIAALAFLIVWIPLGIRRYRIYSKKLDEIFKK